jgi:hypothetical protein
MSKPTKQKPQRYAEEPSEEYLRFERMTTALFQVDKRDIPKHVPKRRSSREADTPKPKD